LPLDDSSLGWDYMVNFNDAAKQAGGALTVSALDNAMLHLPPVDPLRLFDPHRLGYTTSDHENVLGGPQDFEVVPVGPVVNGQVHSP
jgi:hypothetical protein